MCGGFARIAGALEAKIKLDVVLRVELAPLGVEARNIVGGHGSCFSHDLKIKAATFPRAVKFDKKDGLPPAEDHLAVRNRKALR